MTEIMTSNNIVKFIIATPAFTVRSETMLMECYTTHVSLGTPYNTSTSRLNTDSKNQKC